MTRGLILLTASLFITGCGLDIEPTTEAEGVSVDDEYIELPVGLAVGVQLVDAAEDETTRMSAFDPKIIGVGRTPGLHEFVIYGIAPGTTNIEVYIDDLLEGTVETVVVAVKHPTEE
jgi:hypothetical protein